LMSTASIMIVGHDVTLLRWSIGLGVSPCTRVNRFRLFPWVFRVTLLQKKLCDVKVLLSKRL
jgi:hypothetical protein